MALTIMPMVTNTLTVATIATLQVAIITAAVVLLPYSSGLLAFAAVFASVAFVSRLYLQAQIVVRLQAILIVFRVAAVAEATAATLQVMKSRMMISKKLK